MTLTEFPLARIAERCPGCGHSCCPRPGLECGGESDAVQTCERPAETTCRWCGWLLKWPLSHDSCGPNLPVDISSSPGKATR